MSPLTESDINYLKCLLAKRRAELQNKSDSSIVTLDGMSIEVVKEVRKVQSVDDKLTQWIKSLDDKMAYRRSKS